MFHCEFPSLVAARHRLYQHLPQARQATTTSQLFEVAGDGVAAVRHVVRFLAECQSLVKWAHEHQGEEELAEVMELEPEAAHWFDTFDTESASGSSSD